jgi:hypothetical protein
MQVSTMSAHELTHMITYYQRNIRLSDSNYSTFLNEMTAMMTEDCVSSYIDPAYHAIRDTRFKAWLSSGVFNCDITKFGNDCGTNINGYSAAGSFGAYLLRQYGVPFYRNLLNETRGRTQPDIITGALQRTTGDNTLTFSRALQRWSASLAKLPATNIPTGFGYPGRTDGNYSLIPFDGTQYPVAMPYAAPSTLVGYGIYPARQRVTSDTYSHNLPVPAGVTLTVVVK